MLKGPKRKNYLSTSYRWIMLVLFITVLFSCDREVIFDDTKRIRDDVWNQGDKVRFEVPVEKTDVSYKFYLNIRHTTDYRFSNLYLFINSIFPDGSKARDTVECILARPDGEWLGRGVTGIKDNQLLLRTGLRFPREGVYIFEFEQAMRQESLEGITDIGLRIEQF